MLEVLGGPLHQRFPKGAPASNNWECQHSAAKSGSGDLGLAQWGQLKELPRSSQHPHNDPVRKWKKLKQEAVKVTKDVKEKKPELKEIKEA